MSGNFEYDNWQLLYTCTDEQEADMIESFLHAENIDTLKRYPGFSEITKIIGGMTKLGVEIYVRESKYKEADCIVTDIVQEISDDFEGMGQPE